ncbi:hypothetical protein [Crocosphaera chwakensis]|uniref:Uncharacterized protein n=1 Tax=Crocosphaera chwakensis CCY0110 TaxID=391612 RepID=A3IYN8_9CHRO|nr:hypothetical protein [Crocosphaera chwakensis]EAZ88424.1 hypothetical protein CY0110_06479 [Crocosphaera chwakensis CCY0110]
MNNSKENLGSFFKPINLLIAVIIITVIFIIAFYNLSENPESRQIRQTAEKQLRLFARGYSLKAIDCEGIDANNDGWVNCRADDRTGQLLYLECPYQVTDQECRYRD